MSKNTDIFSGIRVIDLTKVFSGPFATRLLADYGAEVIKIESLDKYDDSRDYPPLKNGWSGYYEILNRNKRGVQLNLKQKQDLKSFYELCRSADIIVENLTPSTKQKLKIDYKTIYSYNPRIIYASLSGRGQNNNEKYYDILAQAELGLMSLIGTEKTPTKIGPSVVDAFSGMTLSFAIASALFYRERTGLGQYLDVSMLGASIHLLESNLIGYSMSKKNPKRTGNHDNLIAPFGVFQTKDGSLALAVGNNSQWNQLAKYLGTYSSFDKKMFATNSLRLKNIEVLVSTIEHYTKTVSTKKCLTVFKSIGIACAEVYTMKDIAKNSELYKNKSVISFNHPKLGRCVIPGFPITFTANKTRSVVKAPGIGEHNKLYGI